MCNMATLKINFKGEGLSILDGKYRLKRYNDRNFILERRNTKNNKYISTGNYFQSVESCLDFILHQDKAILLSQSETMSLEEYIEKISEIKNSLLEDIQQLDNM